MTSHQVIPVGVQKIKFNRNERLKLQQTFLLTKMRSVLEKPAKYKSKSFRTLRKVKKLAIKNLVTSRSFVQLNFPQRTVPEMVVRRNAEIEDAFIGFLRFFLGVRSDEIEQVQVNQKFRARYENIACNYDVGPGKVYHNI